MPGLRRSEVAALAGVSVEYYAKLERGSLAGVSAAVLDAIARALQLDDAERAHLLHLAHAADGTDALARAPTRAPQAVDARTEPAMGARRHHRRAGVRPQRPHGPARRQPPRPRLLRRRLRQPPGAAAELRPLHLPRPAPPARFYPDWDHAADICVAILRTEAGRDPHDKDLHDLVGELSTRSDDFRTRWGAHNVRPHGTGTKRFHHPVVGDLTLAYEGLDMAAEPGLTLTIYTAEPGSPSEEGLRLLASWAASHDDASETQAL